MIYTLIATTANANVVIFRWFDLTSLYFGGSNDTDTDTLCILL